MRQVDLLVRSEFDLGCHEPIDGRALDAVSREKGNQLKVGLRCRIDTEIQQYNSSESTNEPKRPEPGAEHDRQEHHWEDESRPEAVLSVKSVEVGIDLRLASDEPSTQVPEVLRSFVDVLSRVDQRIEEAPSAPEISYGVCDESVGGCLFERKPQVSMVGVGRFLACTFTDCLEVPKEPISKCLIFGEARRQPRNDDVCHFSFDEVGSPVPGTCWRQPCAVDDVAGLDDELRGSQGEGADQVCSEGNRGERDRLPRPGRQFVHIGPSSAGCCRAGRVVAEAEPQSQDPYVARCQRSPQFPDSWQKRS